MADIYEFSIGVSTCGNKPVDPAGFAALQAGGIDCIELSFEGYHGFPFKEVSRNAAQAGIKIRSLHLPFSPFEEIDISSLDRGVRENTRHTLTELIGRGAEIGIEWFIVHPSGEPIAAEEREDRMGYSMESLDLLAEQAARYGGVIAVEDLPRSCLGRDSGEIARLLSANERLRVCFDVNHLLGEPIADFIKNVGAKIITTHISDYDFINERHWLPGEGKIDWQELLAGLRAADYRGPWLYEVALAPTQTIDRRDLCYRDFYENAQALFRGERPPAIGRPLV